MRESLRERAFAVWQRLRRVERRELREFRRWLEQTSSLVHLSILLFVPLLIAVVTALSNAVPSLSFLLFPPLASGTYTLFADPEGKYASPRRFVAGLTLGACCGWAALRVGDLLGIGGVSGAFGVSAVEAAIAVLLTGVVTWALTVEEASAFSTALLGLLVPAGDETAFVASVLVASAIVAAVFYVWRERFYEQRARLIYESTDGDDRVLVPMRGENAGSTAMLGARLASAHDAGKVVLLDMVDDGDLARAERDLLDDHRRVGTSATDGGRERVRPADGAAETTTRNGDGTTPATGEVAVSDASTASEDEATDEDDTTAGEDEATDGDAIDEIAENRAASEAATRLEMRAADIETEVGVPCQVVVATTGGSPAATVQTVARETNCDLIATAYEERHGVLSRYVRSLLAGGTDVIVHQSADGRTDWSRSLVPVRRASDVAHSMLDFAARLAGEDGHISVATCIGSERERRRAEETLANLVETVDGTVETRVSTASIEQFLTDNAGEFDLVLMGASTDRSAASRFISPPTFERIRKLDADVAIVDRG